MKRVAVIGAGLAGLTLAQELAGDAKVQVFEKSRGYGGRMATRYGNGFQFDHGAQYFAAKKSGFNNFLAPLLEQGVIARWDARFVEIQGTEISFRWNWSEEVPHYVAVPGMNALGKHLAAELSVLLETRIEEIKPAGKQWRLIDQQGNRHGEYDWVITAVPATQAAVLLPAQFSEWQTVDEIRMTACYSLMLGFDRPLELGWDAALVRFKDISWICNNASKPGRPEQFALLAHSTNRWAETHLELEDDRVTAHLLNELSGTTGQDLSHACHCSLHRWRYANIGKQAGPKAYVDAASRLGAIGDWCISGRVESAYESGRAAAKAIREFL